MLESQMQNIQTIIQSLKNFFNEDKEAQKHAYLDKLEQTLNLTIKFFKKYSKQTKHTYSYHDRILNIYVEKTINIDSESEQWVLTINKEISNFTTKELVIYFWENQMDIKNLINSLFQYIDQLFSKKQQFVTKEKDKYNSEIACLNEAITNLEQLISIEISDEIKDKY